MAESGWSEETQGTMKTSFSFVADLFSLSLPSTTPFAIKECFIAIRTVANKEENIYHLLAKYDDTNN